MPRLHLHAVGTLLVSSVLALGVLTGCGSSDSPDQTPAPDSAQSTGTTSGATEQGSGTKTPGGKKSGSQQVPGHGPASAHDKHGKAPDEVISKRPGGPKAPGSPQPIK